MTNGRRSDSVTPMRLGFIGFGIMGERLLRAARNHDRSKVVVTGVFDPHPSTAQRLAAIDDDLTAFETADAVISASDCLHIASPPASHLDYLMRCANAGKSALCEKPLSTDVVAATRVVGELADRGMHAAVNFPFASSLAVDQLRAWLDADVIGQPQRVDIELGFANWPRSWQMDAVGWLDGRAEGGFTREVGSHFLFLALRMFGDLTLRDAGVRFPEASRSERYAAAELTAGSLPVSLRGEVGATAKDDHNTFTVTGPRGRIRLRDWSIAEREIDGRWEAPADAIPNERARPLILARQLDKLAALSRGEATDLPTLAEALQVQAIVEAILASQLSPAA